MCRLIVAKSLSDGKQQLTVFKMLVKPEQIHKNWSAGRELNPRIQVLQTCALTASPPALLEFDCPVGYFFPLSLKFSAK
jgi:hypothetical protein